MIDYETIYNDGCDAVPIDERNGSDMIRAAGIAAVVATAKREALGEFAATLRERYPEDIFKPLSDGDHRSVNDALAGRLERTHITRDAISADMMRRAAVQADEQAAEIRNEAIQ